MRSLSKRMLLRLKRSKAFSITIWRDSFNDYLRHACRWIFPRKDAAVCKTHPQYFIWPSDQFFIHYRPQ